MSDGSTQDYSSKVTWRASDQTVLSISSTGQATGRAGGETLVTASSSQISARANVIVITPGTFRLIGRVVEFGVAVKDATVAVTSGIGTGLSTQTTFNGDYRLYGVAGEIQVTVTKDGYTPLVQTLMVAQETLADFEIAQTTSLKPGRNLLDDDRRERRVPVRCRLARRPEETDVHRDDYADRPVISGRAQRRELHRQQRTRPRVFRSSSGRSHQL